MNQNISQNASGEKDVEIREYSVRENIFYAAVISEEMKEQLCHLPKAEIMAAVIEIAEQFENSYPNGTAAQMEEYARKRLYQISKK